MQEIAINLDTRGNESGASRGCDGRNAPSRLDAAVSGPKLDRIMFMGSHFEGILLTVHCTQLVTVGQTVVVTGSTVILGHPQASSSASTSNQSIIRQLSSQ